VASHKILVIDDSKVIRMRVREMLPPGNFEVLEAQDGVEGMNLIQKERPNLIMLDFLLPKMSGWEVFQQIRSPHSELQTIPLVLMSGRKEEVTEKIPEPFEYFAFVEKPFEKKQLVEAIKEAMVKAKKIVVTPPRTPVASPGSSDTAASGASGAEIEALKARVEKMQAEIDGLKKQLAQVVTIIKQKLR
jgi:CheY-like chemotaxis protein